MRYILQLRKQTTPTKEERMDYMIGIIRQHQYYGAGVLEDMTEEQVRGIYEAILDWIG